MGKDYTYRTLIQVGKRLEPHIVMAHKVLLQLPLLFPGFISNNILRQELKAYHITTQTPPWLHRRGLCRSG